MKTILLLITILSFTYVSAVDYCNLFCVDYNGVKLENTACKCSVNTSACGLDSVPFFPDAEMKNYIVQLHNEYRERFASGQDNFAPAANIPALAYDDNLQYTAQCWTDRCVIGHDKCRRTEKFEKVGQNFFWSSGRNCGDKQMMKTAVQGWYNEVSDATKACLKRYNGCSGHFTQLIWAATTHVGCARRLWSEGCTIICNYGPAGNMLDAPAYRPGTPTCETETKYPHLCKAKAAISNEIQTRKGSATNHKLSRRALLVPMLVLVPHLCSIL